MSNEIAGAMLKNWTSPNIVHPDEADLLEEAKSIARILYLHG